MQFVRCDWFVMLCPKMPFLVLAIIISVVELLCSDVDLFIQLFTQVNPNIAKCELISGPQYNLVSRLQPFSRI